MKHKLLALASLLSLTGISALPPAPTTLLCLRENQEGEPWQVELTFQGPDISARVTRPGRGSRPYEVNLQLVAYEGVDLYAGKGFEASLDLNRLRPKQNPFLPGFIGKPAALTAFLSDEETFEENVPLACVKARSLRTAEATALAPPASHQQL